MLPFNIKPLSNFKYKSQDAAVCRGDRFHKQHCFRLMMNCENEEFKAQYKNFFIPRKSHAVCS